MRDFFILKNLYYVFLTSILYRMHQGVLIGVFKVCTTRKTAG